VIGNPRVRREKIGGPLARFRGSCVWVGWLNRASISTGATGLIVSRMGWCRFELEPERIISPNGYIIRIETKELIGISGIVAKWTLVVKIEC